MNKCHPYWKCVTYSNELKNADEKFVTFRVHRHYFGSDESKRVRSATHIKSHQWNHSTQGFLPVRASPCLIKAGDFELGSICPHENSLNPVLPSLGAHCCNTEAPLIRIRDISYDQRNAISRTSPRLTKWSFANPPQLLIAATNIAGHRRLHPPTQIWLMKHRLRLSVLFTLVYHSGVKTHLWKCNPSAVIHFIMIYVPRVCGKMWWHKRRQPTIQRGSFNQCFFFLCCVCDTDGEIMHINIHQVTKAQCVTGTQEWPALQYDGSTFTNQL